MFALVVLVSGASHGAWTHVWSLGDLDGDRTPFSGESWVGNSSPTATSATTLDNDYFFAGIFAAPVGTVATAEPLANVEGALSTWDDTTRIHFTLSAAQKTATTQLRFFIMPIWGGFSGGATFGTHTLRAQLNGTTVMTKTFSVPQLLTVTFDGASAVIGENVLELKRTGGSPNGWFSIDALGLDVHPTALDDADGDGLPLVWEEAHGMSDANPADAAMDFDHDGKTNAQEFALGTDPHLADTDGDGLSDGAETTTNPLLADTDGDGLSDGFELSQTPALNPLSVDTDGDGAPDAWELRAGTSPTSAASTPPAFAGAIGIHFSSEIAPANVLTPYEVTGLVPQLQWNNTMLLSQWDSAAIAGTQTKIVSPEAGVLRNSAGAASGATISWSATATWASGNSGSATQNLLNAGLWVNSDTPASVTFAGIPYATYDVIVYVGNTYDGGLGYVRLNDQSASDYWFSTSSAKPRAELIEPVSNSDISPRRGNAIRFRNVSGSSCNVKLFRDSWHEVALHGVQIVSATSESDGDGMPDWFELTYALNRSSNDAGGDPDGDGLTNLQEYQRGTNPRLADTDGDGLSDAVETNTGTFASVTNTGSNPLNADTDGDGVSDGAEINHKPVPMNPNLADSDSDGVDDAAELKQNTDPTVASASSALMPLKSANSFNWTLYTQFIWDHERAAFTDREWGDSYMAWLEVQNREANVGGAALAMGLRFSQGSLTALLHSNHYGAFSYSNNPGGDIWHSDWNSPPASQRAAMGFSGYGRQDISDRLRLRVSGSTTGAASAWTITWSVFNLDTNQTVMTQTFANCTLAANVHLGSVTWTDANDVENQLYQEVHAGIQMFLLPGAGTTSLKLQAAYANVSDTDKDGMPDVWETANSFNPNSAADGPQDADGDGLTNVREYVLGTNPRNADSDGDGARDGAEVDARSNPLLASSKPPFWNGLPSGVASEDMNGNGISDAFELWLGRFDLVGTADDDHDGQTNAEEAIAGTNPLDAASRLWVGGSRSGNDMIIAWPRLLNKAHQVQQSDDLTGWSPVSGTPATGSNEYHLTISNAYSLPKKFYRASVNNVDSDGDGVSDWAEVNVLNSNSLNANSLGSSFGIDTNGDGVADSSVSGDLSALIQRLQGGGSAGGFVGGSAGAGIAPAQASRFLMQASFGPTLADIERVQQLGYAGWIAEQKALPATLHSTYIKRIIADVNGARADRSYNANEDGFLFGNNMNTAFARAAIQGSDQLRQRVAFALSQILVTSRKDANLENQILGMSDYYDIFVKRAFGNYYDVLLDVTLHPCMGRYLSHVGNQKAKPEINQYPDENYAREVMQLFSIGLWELHPDGTRKVDGTGTNIPTYTNTEITELARVMTGLWFGEHDWGQGGWSENDYATPMTMHAGKHDFDAKTIVGGKIIPAREPTDEAAMQDIRDAIRTVFEHPNTGPFICKQLIQFLVTDNPSPAFVQRVAGVFADNGSGVRGDLGAVVSAILLDDDARNPAVVQHDAAYGRLKEPVIRAMAIGRAFGLITQPDLLWWNWGSFYDASRQDATYSPSVFNFYRPEYKAPGLLTASQKNSPVFQITDTFSSISFPNKLWELVDRGFEEWSQYSFPLDLSREVALAATPEKLVDHLNLLLCAGQMSAGSRTIILNGINQIPVAEAEARARVAVYSTIVCPESAVMK